MCFQHATFSPKTPAAPSIQRLKQPSTSFFLPTLFRFATVILSNTHGVSSTLYMVKELRFAGKALVAYIAPLASKLNVNKGQ